MIIQPGVTSGTGYSFNTISGSITFTGLVPPNLESILTVTNSTTGTILFQPQAGVGFTGTWASPVLSLAASTAGMSNTDRLLVLFEDGNLTSAGTPTVADPFTENLLEMLMRIVKLLESNAVVDQQQRQRLTLDAITANLTLSSVGSLSNVTTVANLAALAGMDREQFINIAKQTYSQSIRSQLTFS